MRKIIVASLLVAIMMMVPLTTASILKTTDLTILQIQKPKDPVDDLEVTVNTDKTIYNQSEPVKITISLTNNGDEGITLFFSSSTVDFEVFNESNESVYIWSKNNEYSPWGCIMRINSGETKILLRYSWNQSSDKGDQVPGGKYHIDGWIVVSLNGSSVGYVTEIHGSPVSITIIRVLYVGGYGPGNYSVIQEAINDANDGDTVFVYNESSPYYERIIVNRSINLIGEDRWDTIIDAQSNGDVVKIISEGVTISGFTLENADGYKGYAGIRVFSSNTTISFNNIYHSDHGVFIKEYSSNNSISDNWFSSISWTDIGLIFSNCNIISDNRLWIGAMIGLKLDNAHNNIVSNNRIAADSGTGLLVKESDHNIIEYNHVTVCQDGIRLVDSEHNILSYNNVSSNMHQEIELSSSNYNEIYNNTFSLGYNGDGMEIWHSSFNNIYNNTVSSNDGDGIKLIHNSINNNIYNNNINSNTNKGIYLLEASNSNKIYENDIRGNKRGVYIDSDDNDVYKNNVTENDYGVYIMVAHGNTICENNVTNNAKYGVYIDKKLFQNSYNNNIYHNNFINNSKNAYDKGKNTWYDAYPSGGNYWDDYNGKDRFHGPKQNRLGSDGIGDRSYRIGPFLLRNMDEYPLMKPYGASTDTNLVIQNNKDEFLNSEISQHQQIFLKTSPFTTPTNT